jgi:hypothetical protein
LKDLEEFEKITKQLQNSDTILSDVRAIFDAAIEQYPSLNFYLEADAQIVHSPSFESGIVKLLDDEVDQLTERERHSVGCFRYRANDMDNIVAMDDNLSLTIDIAATFHENKRPKKTYSENHIKSDLNVAGTLDLVQLH